LIELSGKRSAFQKRVIECIRQMARKIQPPPYRHCEEGGVWIEWMIFFAPTYGPARPYIGVDRWFEPAFPFVLVAVGGPGRLVGVVRYE
jgi:hypothetical protein